MRPFVAILGFIAGSLVSLAFGLAVVLLVFWLLRGEHPQFAAELPEVARSCILFFVLAVLSALSFWATVHNLRWRHLSLSVMWLGLAVAGLYYWPG